jgi:hypothetical protein
MSRPLRLLLPLAFLLTVAPAPRAASPDLSRFAASLAAGEFGAATDLALANPDPRAQSQQLSDIAQSQLAFGDSQPAWNTARRISDPTTRNATFDALRQNRPLAEFFGTEQFDGNQASSTSPPAGGGSQADFSQLISLITSTISPEGWTDAGGAGSITPYVTGVFVDPLTATRSASADDGLAALGAEARCRPADLPEELARPSDLRYVSLRALEAAVKDRAAQGLPPTVTQQFLAGLTRVRYLLVDREGGDILLAGPASGWEYTAEGVPLSLSGKRPPLRLDDLILLCRLFEQPRPEPLGCSINPRPDNLRAMKEFAEASQAKGPLRPSAVGKWTKDLEQRLGEQDVVVFGLPADSRTARVLVEADYRMKLIGIGKLAGGPGIPDYFQLLKQAGQTSGGKPLEALRWWLTLRHDAIRHSPDRSTFEITGSTVLAQSENQFVSARGENLPTGLSEPINRRFAENLTKHYDELSERDPVFAELRNIFDLAIVAALLRTQNLARTAGWEHLPFTTDLGYTPPRLPPRTTVPSVVNHKVFGGRDIVVQVAGGVQAPILDLLAPTAMLESTTALPATLRPRPANARATWTWSPQNP